ncbi:hypothetical protein VF14_09010 [Nostoc linckia z18]|uniref:Contractile injection system tube protein N-terminal domain-containing protein n=2 Tax=Nostoc linckia TaxID=92942 RepID=A0A9Q5ZEP7_NOSLI|nr:hypothetical protein [Nostoc linckia]PHK32498.1 hypothetical protein VF12_26620 [Nostoc linckia z15]PHK44556.1 hypothetical protein VF13_21360 [Nostoc linckia z16]PHJ59600.1 hypothetical protein VF02_24635 [Nostoc linckia z1]PHJ65122.1 hypothetical protein VF05_21515 [Nostoc linckia z3]PHJ69605.1 hypothetical protein VF03_23715 [Nostoc linckia z2]
MRYNSVYSQLPDASKEGASIEAVLLEYDISGNVAKPLWLFLVNPQSLRFSREAKYTEISPLASQRSEVQYTATTGQTLSIPDLILQTWYCGKSLRPLIEGINLLLEADIKNKKYSPPILKFQWGTREFGPCVLTSIQWEESAWLGGEPASVKLGLELKEVPKAISRGEVEQQKTKNLETTKTTREKQSKPRLPLTDRQRADASAAAKKYLETNIKQWAADVQAAIRGNKYKLSTDASSGAVSMTGAGGKTIGTVLAWDGFQAKTGQGVTTIPLVTGGKAP